MNTYIATEVVVEDEDEVKAIEDEVNAISEDVSKIKTGLCENTAVDKIIDDLLMKYVNKG